MTAPPEPSARAREMRPIDRVTDAMFWVLMIAASVRFLSNHGIDAVTAAVVLLASASAMAYAVGSLGTPSPVRERIGFAALVPCWAALTVIAPSFGWAAVPVFFAAHRTLVGGWAVASSAIVTLAVAVGPLRLNGIDDLPAVIGILGSGIVLSMTYATLDRLFRARTRLAEELLATSERLALSERQSGIAIERQRIASELHDTVTQSTASAVLLLEAVEETWDQRSNRARDVVGEARQILRGSIEQTRRIVHGSPGRIDGSLIEELAVASGAAGAQLRVHGDAHPLPDEVEYALARVAGEAILNASKHARAGTIIVTVTFEDDAVTIDVGDDGVGMRGSARSGGGFGMTAMRWRMANIGGTLDVQSAKGRGTIVTATAPIDPHGENA